MSARYLRPISDVSDVSATAWTLENGAESYWEAIGSLANPPGEMSGGGYELQLASNSSGTVTVNLDSSPIPSGAAITAWRAFAYLAISGVAGTSHVAITADDAGNNLPIDDVELFEAGGSAEGWYDSGYVVASTIPATLAIFGSTALGATITCRVAFVEVCYGTANTRLCIPVALRL